MRILLRLAFLLVRFLPKTLWVALIHGLAFLASRIPSKERAKIMANFHRVSFDFGELSARQFARQVFFHQGLMAVETLRYSFDPSEVIVDGLEGYREELSQQVNGESSRGAIIATGHIGSWELVGAATAKAQGKTFTALAKAPQHPELLAALSAFRERMAISSLWNRDSALVKKMLGTLRAGDALGMVIDQKPQGRKGYSVTFLGEPTEMVSGPVKMGRKTSATVYGVYCLRKAPFHYQLTWQRIADADSMVALSDDQLAQLLADSMERAIAKAPSQWAWNYKRWSPPPREDGPRTAAQTL